MKFISWNVNGIRSVMKKGFLEFVKKHPFDVLCLQETRSTRAEAGLDLPGYEVYWNEAEKKGYAGTGVLTKVKPVMVTYGMGHADHDREGRLITVEFPDFFLVNTYQPNSQRGLLRLDYRTQAWDPATLAYLRNLEKKKPVIIGGDMNVAHEEIDLANPKSNRRNAGFTDEERAEFGKLIENGFIDTFREFEKGGGHYTWWSNFANCRARNIGWRVDYFLISSSLRPRLLEASILSHAMGSDHCPVILSLAEN